MVLSLLKNVWWHRSRARKLLLSLGRAFQYIDVAELHHHQQAPPQAFSESVNVLHHELSDITSSPVVLLGPRRSRGSVSTSLFVDIDEASVWLA